MEHVTCLQEMSCLSPRAHSFYGVFNVLSCSLKQWKVRLCQTVSAHGKSLLKGLMPLTFYKNCSVRISDQPKSANCNSVEITFPKE